MTMNPGFQLFTGEDIDAAIEAARLSKPRTILQIVADMDTGLLPATTFDFPYQNAANVEVFAYVAGPAVPGWVGLADESIANSSLAPLGNVQAWWTGDGATITLNYTNINLLAQIMALRLISYE